MNKRLWVRISVITLGVLLISVPFLITFFFFPAYRSVGLGLMLFLVAGLQWYTGMKQRQAAKRRGEALLPWWKHSLLVMALMWGCFGMLECLVGMSVTNTFVHTVFESNLGGFFGMLFVLFTIGVGIYAIVLTLKYLETSKLVWQHLGEWQDSRPIIGCPGGKRVRIANIIIAIVDSGTTSVLMHY